MIQIHSGETSRPADFVARSLLRTYERSTCCSKSTLLLVLPSLLPEENTSLHIVRVVFSQGLLCTVYLDKFEVLINAKK